VCTAILRPAPADSSTVEAQDDGADDGAMEPLDPGVMEAEVMRGSPGWEHLAAGQRLTFQALKVTASWKRPENARFAADLLRGNGTAWMG
jgi:hypothetical protein